MAYLLSQIWLCLLITALIAGLLGWLLRGGGKKKLRVLNTKWQDKYDALSQERNSYASKINKLSGVMHEKERLESKIETQKHIYDQKLTRLTTQLATADEEAQKQQSLLAQKDEELTMSMAQFDSKISEYEVDQQSSHIDLEKKLEKSSSQLSLLEKEANNKLKEYQQKNTILKTQLKSVEADLNDATNKLVDVEDNLGKGELQVDNLTKGFAIKEKRLTEQLEQKEQQISEALAAKEKAEVNLQQANRDQEALKKDFATKENKLNEQFAKEKDHLLRTAVSDKEKIVADLSQKSPVVSDNITTPSANPSKESLRDKVSAAKDSAIDSIKAPLDYAKNTLNTEETSSTLEAKIEAKPAQNKIKQKIDAVRDGVLQQATKAKEVVTAPVDHVVQRDVEAEEKSVFSDIKEKFESSGVSDKLKSGLDKAKEGINSAKEEIAHKASDAKDAIKSYNNNQDSDEKNPTQDNDDKSSRGIKGVFASAGIAGLAMSGLEKAKDGFSQAKESLTHYPDAEESIFPIDAIQSISNEDDRRLYTMGIKTTQDLLSKTSTETGINLLSKSLGKEEWVIRTWVNNADLIRIKGVDGILAELLELAGFNTVSKLASSSAEEVLQGISKVHEHITKRTTLPNIDEIQGLINGGKALG
ncbi:MAG TPA: DUF4332 domain-containing protein [Leucothrix mucor]|uniref:DUF4332 domain-containing protein n=1 Tax=Leucothrix mucor TaxID=45248 RepID=A0A7V2T3P4_LEUMU|nr:DUF4332 domain-containing protein [Leucothrix mucor]